MLDQAIFKEIQKAWMDDQQHPRRDREEEPVPDLNSIKEIVETAFWTSLKKEEEQPITFSLVLLDRELAKNSLKAGRSQLIMSFDEPVDLSAESLVKLAPAFNPKLTSLIVFPGSDDKKTFEIWGAMFFTPFSSILEEIPVQIGNQIFSRPDAFMVTATSPGSLIVSRANSQIGRLFLGKFVRATHTPFHSSAMGNWLMKLIENDMGFKNYQNYYWHLFRESLDVLLSESSQRGHGASIVFLPNRLIGDINSSITNKISFSESLMIEELINGALQIPQKPEGTLLTLGYYKRLHERVSTLAQLSCIDGVLIISGTFEVVAFGAKLNSPKWNGEVVVGSDGFSGGGGKFDHSILGTRHNSIIDFVGEYSDSIGFVISQDGPIRGFAKKDNEMILCWPDCRVSMFI